MPIQDTSVELKNHQDKIGLFPLWHLLPPSVDVVTTVAEMLAEQGVKLYIHPSHNVPGDTTAKEKVRRRLLNIKTYSRRVGINAARSILKNFFEKL